MSHLLADVKFALRALARRPGFALVAVSTLAVGIGANTAVYSIAEAVLLRPLPFREPERLVMVWERNLVRERTRNVVNPGNYLAWRDRNDVFEDIAAFSPFSVNLTGDQEPLRLDIAVVTGNFFSTLGVSPVLGRGLTPEDAKEGAAPVIILSDGLWRRRFGADPGVLGRDVMLSDGPVRVIGVMGPPFQVPPGAEAWAPLTEGGPGLRRDSRGRYLLSVARLKPGVTVTQAQVALEGLASQLTAERPEFNTGWTVFVAPLHADLVRDAKPAVLVLAGAVALLLLIACGNVANLLLVRALSRVREIAVRRALGASPGRIAAQLLTESAVLAVLAGGLGLGLAAWMKQGLLAAVPAEVQALFAVNIDPRVAGFALGLSFLSALVFGLVPAFQAAGKERLGALHDGASGSGASRERRRLTRLVVGAEVALSLVLLAGAGLLLRSFWRLSSQEVGFDTKGVLSLGVTLSGPRYAEPAAVAAFYQDSLQRLAALPGVTSAAAMSWRPLGVGMATSFAAPDLPTPAPGQEPTADVRMVSPDFLATMGITLREGRFFDARDVAGRPDVVVVNERLARQLWPGQSALGRKIHMEANRRMEGEIVGVVGDVRIVGLDQEPRAQLYWPMAQSPFGLATILLKTGGRPESLATPAREAIAAVDPALPVAKIVPLDAIVGDALRRPRFTFVLIGAFALTAALLAGLGLFGVLSYSVAQRLPEIGVRLALGARPADVARLVLREGVVVAAAGAAAGIAASAAAAGALRGLLYETNPRDPVAFLAVTGFVMVLAALATALPARRASRVNPLSALRSE